MRKILDLFAHPKYEYSDANHALIQSIENLENVPIRDLYKFYPYFYVNIQEERRTFLKTM